MAFSRSFGNADQSEPVNISSSGESDSVEKDAADPAEPVNLGSSSESDSVQKDAAAAPVSVPTSEAAASRMKGGVRELWLPSEDCGFCTGSNQLPCCFGPNGEPARAEPNGRCDLCCTAALQALDGAPLGQARITHLLKNLNGKPLLPGYARIGIALGEEARDKYKFREQPGKPRNSPAHPQLKDDG